MEIVHDKINGDLHISTDYIIHGMVVGNVIMKNGGKLVLHGMITKDLTLENGSDVTIHGMVCGNVYNKGGLLKISGMIIGSLHKESGTTIVDPHAVVGKLN